MKLQICDLCKQFDGVPVLDHVSMELESGHIYCLTAPSGKGKTTLFRILMGLETADSGRLFMERVPIGAVFQEDRGQKRRVAICRALCALSELLILDEPFTGLDAGTKADVIRYLQKKSAGKLTLLSTHQEEDILALDGIQITI